MYGGDIEAAHKALVVVLHRLHPRERRRRWRAPGREEGRILNRRGKAASAGPFPSSLMDMSASGLSRLITNITPAEDVEMATRVSSPHMLGRLSRLLCAMVQHCQGA